MKTLKVKDIVIGDGIPKICVPIVARTKKEIIEEAANLVDTHADIVEWRVDWFQDAIDFVQIIDVLKGLASVLNNIPILFTFRTAKEGGKKPINPKAYAELNKAAVVTGLVDLIDVEVFTGDELVLDIIDSAHLASVKVIASNHEFAMTPTKEEMVNRLRKMQDMGADMCKIAVMPKSKMDVLELLRATVIMSEQYADRPITTTSMSALGVISRLSGEIYGSALTFGAAKKASAPGQIGVEDLYDILQSLHDTI